MEKEQRLHSKLKEVLQQLDKMKASSVVVRLDNAIITGKYGGTTFEISPDSELRISWEGSKEIEELTFTMRINNIFIGAEIEPHEIPDVLRTRQHKRKDDTL